MNTSTTKNTSRASRSSDRLSAERKENGIRTENQPDPLDPYEAANRDPVTYWAFNVFALCIIASVVLGLSVALGFVAW